MKYYSSNFTLGILGGGQLGKMLLGVTQRFDIRTSVLDPAADAPCAEIAHQFTQGSLTDFDTVYNFGKTVDLLTFEIELVNVDALEKLESEGVKVFPSSKTLRQIQHKGRQKDFYVQHGLPTAPYTRFDDLQALTSAIETAQQPLPFVWKSAEFGYDGNGVKIVRTAQDVASLPNQECIAEALIPFKHELAVIVARNPSGQTAIYPVVEMEFHPEANQVEYVICPARISEETARKATEVALTASEKLNHIGLLAVEMFETQTGEILINEMAPRVHNSGHYSIEAAICSQFENHLRAILDLPLGSTESLASAVMVNLVGEAGHSGNVVYQNMDKILEMPGVSPHIYGKKQTRPMRKMGHVTIVHPNIDQARALAASVKSTIKVISE